MGWTHRDGHLEAPPWSRNVVTCVAGSGRAGGADVHLRQGGSVGACEAASAAGTTWPTGDRCWPAIAAAGGAGCCRTATSMAEISVGPATSMDAATPIRDSSGNRSRPIPTACRSAPPGVDPDASARPLRPPSPSKDVDTARTNHPFRRPRILLHRDARRASRSGWVHSTPTRRPSITVCWNQRIASADGGGV